MRGTEKTRIRRILILMKQKNERPVDKILGIPGTFFYC